MRKYGILLIEIEKFSSHATFRPDKKFALIKSINYSKYKKHATSNFKLWKFGNKIPVVNVVEIRKKSRKTLIK